MRTTIVSLLLVAVCLVAASSAHAQTLINPNTQIMFPPTIDVPVLSGATADAQITYCLQHSIPSGGICDARAYGATVQTFNAPVSVSANQTILFSPATVFVPALPGMIMLNIGPGATVDGANLNPAALSGYTGTAIALLQNYDPTSMTTLRNIQINLPSQSGTGVYISPSASGNGASGIHFQTISITGGLYGFSLVAGPGQNQYINGNLFSDMFITVAVTCINMDGRAQTPVGPLNTAIAANQFINVNCEHGVGVTPAVTGLKLQNASNNTFHSVGAWDYDTATPASWDSNSGYNWWDGLSAAAVASQPGPGNNYYDARNDAVSSSGEHNFNYPGGVDFIGGKLSLQATPSGQKYDLAPTASGIQIVTLGCCASTYLTGNYINTPGVQINGSPIASTNLSDSSTIVHSSAPVAGHVACIKSSSPVTIGYCSTAPDSNGACSCN